jgi:protein-disulfide isomerase
VSASRFSEVGGVPLAAMGAMYFIVLLLLGLLQSPGSKGFTRSQTWMALLSALALSVDVGLLGVQAFAIRSFCLFCLATYACTLAHLGLNWLLLPASQRRLKALFVTDKKSQVPALTLALTSMGVVVSAALIYRFAAPISLEQQSAGFEQAKKSFLDNWDRAPSSAIAVRPTDATWGNPKAKVQIVLFSDFECPHCQRAAFAMHTAIAPEEERVWVIFKHFPLDMSCNRLLTQPIHANACALSHLAYCANKKGRFWDFHDRVFFKLSARELSSTRDQIWDGVRNVFSREEFDQCLSNPEALANTQADIEQGNALEINSTPTIFINGKRVTLAPTVDLLRELIQKEASK